jgi:hypothetical protein
MRLHPLWGFIVFLLAMLAAGSLAHAAEPRSPDGYETRTIEGFTVYANKNVIARQNRPLDVLERELNDLKRILKPRIVGVLQTVPIWAEWDVMEPGRPGVIARYLWGSSDQLSQSGIDPRKADCVEVMTLRRLGEMPGPGTALQQVILLHEMCHVVHHRMLGIDNPELQATFQSAIDRKLYDEVNDRLGRRGRAYGRTNAAEYFAEISCAYLDSCNFFPFNQQQLRGYDPQGFAFIERVWREPERFQVISVKQRDPLATTKKSAVHTNALVPPPAPPVDVAAERDAMMRLDKLKGLVRSGKNDDARQALQKLIQSYPSTDAAGEARQMLQELK